jgi:hypothetical protein
MNAKDASECAVSAVELTRRMFHVNRNGKEDERMMAKMMAEAQGKEAYGSTLTDNTTSSKANNEQSIEEGKKENRKTYLSEVNALLCFVRCCSGSLPGKAAACSALKLLHELLDDIYSREDTYVCLQTLGGAAEIVPLVSRPGKDARIAAIGLLGRVLAESRRIVICFQHSRMLSDKANDGGIGGIGIGGIGYHQPKNGRSKMFEHTNTIIEAQSMSSIYNSKDISISNLPSEAKPNLMIRLMSATLIELTSKETLAMVSCADDCWSGGDDDETEKRKTFTDDVIVEEHEEDDDGWSSINKIRASEKEEENKEKNNTDRSFVWPPLATSRHVSEETIDAVIEMITGSHRKEVTHLYNALLFVPALMLFISKRFFLFSPFTTFQKLKFYRIH